MCVCYQVEINQFTNMYTFIIMCNVKTNFKVRQKMITDLLIDLVIF